MSVEQENERTCDVCGKELGPYIVETDELGWSKPGYYTRMILIDTDDGLTLIHNYAACSEACVHELDKSLA